MAHEVQLTQLKHLDDFLIGCLLQCALTTFNALCLLYSDVNVGYPTRNSQHHFEQKGKRSGSQNNTVKKYILCLIN